MNKLISTLAFSLIFILTSNAQSHIESFDGNNLPTGWTTFTEVGFDFVNVFDGEISLFKQSSGDEVIILASPEFDLAGFNTLQIDYYGFNLAFGSESVPSLHVGIMDNPGEFESFRPIYELKVDNTASELLHIDLGAYNDQGNIAFKLVGEKSQIIYLDNFKLDNTGEEADFPIAVSNISATALTDGSNDVSFTWNNPSLQADGDLLTELTHISVRSAGSELIRFENPNIGEEQTFIGTIPNPGPYQFEIVPVNSAGDGHPISTSPLWVGLDLPAMVTDLDINQNDNQAILTWSHPLEGANGGFFNGDLESYIIRRSDGREFTIPGSSTEFVDQLDAEGSINYRVIPTNSSGEGLERTSDPIFYVSADHIYFEDFNFDIVSAVGESSDYDFQWTSESNAANTTWDWFASNFNGVNAGELSWLWTGSGSNNDRVSAISPEINTVGFESISLSFNYYFENANYSVLIQSSSDGGSTWNDIDQIDVSNSLLNENFTKTIANEDVGSDQFQIAFTRLGPANQNPFMRIDNIRIIHQPGVDLRVLNIEAPEEVEPGDEVSFIGSFENNSSEIVSGLVTFEILERFTGNSEAVETWTLAVDDMPIGEIFNENFGNWIAQEGEYTLQLRIEGSDDTLLDNNTITQNINVFKLRDRDLVVIEEFSGTWCAYCPGAALGVEDLYLEGYNVGAITYHRGDDYEEEIVEEKMNQYSVFGFPTVIFDGVVKVEGGDLNNSIVDQYRPVVEAQQAKRSPLHIEFIGAENQSNGTYKLTGVVNSETSILNPNLQLILAVTESHIEEEWQSLQFLDYLQREYHAEVINLENNSYHFDISIPIGNEIDPGNADVIVFVQDPETNQVYNGNMRKLSEDLVSINDTALNKVDVKLFPNPVDNLLQVSIFDNELKMNELRIKNMQGIIMSKQRINSNSFEINTEGLNQGMYVLEMSNGERIFVKRFIKL